MELTLCQLIRTDEGYRFTIEQALTKYITHEQIEKLRTLAGEIKEVFKNIEQMEV